MFVLLKELQRIRRERGLKAPEERGSLAVRHVDAGSCNGCEHEISAMLGPFYDLSRYGISVVASPRHADVLLVTGCVTTRMAEPLRIAYKAMPEPRLVVAMGECALGRGLLGDPAELAGPVERIIPVDVRVPGCPPEPRVLIEHLREALALRHGRRQPTQGREP